MLQGGGRPDVLVEEASGWPVVIEAELSNHTGADKDAVERLGRVVQRTGLPIETAIALVYPAELHTLDGPELRNAIRSTESFEYALYTHMINRPPERLPASGWLTGTSGTSQSSSREQPLPLVESMLLQDDFKTEFNGPRRVYTVEPVRRAREVRRWRPCSASLTTKKVRPGEWP